MVNFTYLKVLNFASIGEFELYINKGITNILGNNGVGKTTVLMAFLQGLYNRNIKNEKDAITDTYNKYTNKPYYIEIHFTKLAQGKEIKYKVINDRGKNKIDIFENDVLISKKGIKQQLTQIENIIGLDYNMFSSFYYLSVNTLSNIFDVSNNQNLVFKFFDIATLDNLLKWGRKEKKELVNRISVLNINIRTLNNQLENLKKIKPINEQELLTKKTLFLDSLNQLEESEQKKELEQLKQQIILLESKQTNFNNKILTLKTEIIHYQDLQSKLEKGICPVCQQDTTTVSTLYLDKLKKAESGLDVLIKQLNSLKSKIEELKNNLNEKNSLFELKKNEIKKELNYVNTQLLLAKDNTTQYDNIKETIGNIEKEVNKLKTIVNDLQMSVIALDTIINILQSKVLLKQYLQAFLILLNTTTENLVKQLDFNLRIIVYEVKGKLQFKFLNNDVEVSLHSLSSGEKTRVSIIVLFSILETLKSLSNTQFNLLALDEVLGVLDKDGVELLKQVLNLYKKDLSIFLIQHHKEIEDSFFDSTIKLTKINNLTYRKE